jgi:hypothetical protein
LQQQAGLFSGGGPIVQGAIYDQAFRLELPGRFSIESFFPGWKQGDAMNITLVPSSSELEKERRGKPTEARSISFGERWSW